MIPRSDVTLAAPLRPSTILCSGSNYRDHNAEKANTPISGKEPEFFVKTADCVVGPDEPIVFDPLLSKKIDCEVELAIVIGKPGRHIPIERALDHVFGYTIVNDVTARDRQVRRTPEGKPDFQGFYESNAGGANYGLEKHPEGLSPGGRGVIVDPPDGKLPMRQWAVDELAERNTDARGYDDPTAHCFPAGVPRSMYVPVGIDFIQTKRCTRHHTLYRRAVGFQHGQCGRSCHEGRGGLQH